MTSSGNLWPYRCPLVINYYMYFRIMIQSSFQSVIMWSVYIVMYVVSFGTLLWTYRSIGKISYYLGNVIYFCVFYVREICLWIQICTSNRSWHPLSWIVEYEYEKYLDFEFCARQKKKSKTYKKRKINIYEKAYFILNLINPWGPTSDFVFMYRNAIWIIVSLPIIQ